MRNALVLLDQGQPDFSWTPANVPSDYLQEGGPVDPFFKGVAIQLELTKLPNDWERALAISRHLLGSSEVLRGHAIKSDLHATYQRIVSDGEGYCGDFVDVFMAIALAAGIPVRSWAFSFDGFGGHGHIWPEIWNRQLGRWQLVGIFNNYYFYETVGVPLSALEFRLAMKGHSKQLKLAPLYPGARVGWSMEAKAWDYYRRGLDQWYMWWGNNVYSYDRTFAVRVFSGWSRSLEQLGAIFAGVHPRINLLRDAANEDAVNALSRLRMHLIAVAWIGALMAPLALFCLIAWVRARRHRISCLNRLSSQGDAL
jgi:hypothetical protein